MTTSFAIKPRLTMTRSSEADQANVDQATLVGKLQHYSRSVKQLMQATCDLTTQLSSALSSSSWSEVATEIEDKTGTACDAVLGQLKSAKLDQLLSSSEQQRSEAMADALLVFIQFQLSMFATSSEALSLFANYRTADDCQNKQETVTNLTSDSIILNSDKIYYTVIKKEEPLVDGTSIVYADDSTEATFDDGAIDGILEEITTTCHYCNVCSKIYGNLKSYRKHMRECTDKQKLCATCGQSCAESCLLKRQTSLRKQERDHKCNICNKTFTRSDILRDHSRIHDGIRPHECSVCKRTFTQSSTLRKHMVRHTKSKPYKCHLCSKEFTQLGNLKRHVLRHAGVSKYKCEICQKKFTRTFGLKRHMERHDNDEIVHKCNQCDKEFDRGKSLRVHMMIHECRKCIVCEQEFTDMDSMNNHLMAHVGGKSFKCFICGKNFTQTCSLKAHFLVHKGERSHLCSICGKKFSTAGQLKRHVEILHS